MSDIQGLASRIALIGTLTMLMLVGVSAYLRLSAANLGCEPWPACFAQASHAAPSTEGQPHPVARLAHRILASAAGVIVLLVAFVDLRARAGSPRRIARAVLLVVLTAALASLGRFTPGATSLAVALGNLLGGAALTVLLWWAALDPPAATARFTPAHPPPLRSARVRWLAYSVLVVAAIQFILGALISTTGAAAQCGTLPLCAAGTSTAAEFLHLAHRLTALLLIVAAGGLAVVLLRGGPRPWRCITALGVVVLLQSAAGVSMIISGFPLWLALAHNLGGVLVLLAAVAAVCA
jgi:cytochrome c oxidase assembly protein subunit 15